MFVIVTFDQYVALAGKEKVFCQCTKSLEVMPYILVRGFIAKPFGPVKICLITFV